MRYIVIILFLISCSTTNENNQGEEITEEAFRGEINGLNKEDSLNHNAKASKEEDCQLIYSESISQEITFAQAIDTVLLDSAILVFYDIEGHELPLSKRDYYIEQSNCLNRRSKTQWYTSIDSSIVVTDTFLAYKTLKGYDTITFSRTDGESALTAAFLDYLKVPDLNFIGVYGYEGRFYRLIDRNGTYFDIQSKPIFNSNWTMFIDAGTAYDLSEAAINIYRKNQNKFVKEISFDITSNFEEYWIPRFPVWLNDSTMVLYRDTFTETNGRYIGMRIKRL